HCQAVWTCTRASRRRSGEASGSRARPLPTPLSRGSHAPSASLYHRRRPKKGPVGFFPSPKKRQSTLTSRGFAAFVSSHLYSMSSHLDTKRNSLTSLSRCGTILRKSAPQTQKKEKDLSPDVSVIRRQAKKGDRLLGRASCVEQGLRAGLTFRPPRVGRVLH